MGEHCCEAWEYRSVSGMMLYLAGSTRSDIVYVVHQCVRFSYNPKKIHEVGVKHIAQYLKGTSIKGIIMSPDLKNMRIDLYADAYFADLYATEDKMDPVSVKGRTSVFIMSLFYGAQSYSLR